MRLGQVSGAVWATKKSPALAGQILLRVHTAETDLIAADLVGAGEGDTIEYTTRIYKKSYTVVPGETVKASVGGFPKVDDNPETDDKYTIPPMIFVKAK